MVSCSKFVAICLFDDRYTNSLFYFRYASHCSSILLQVSVSQARNLMRTWDLSPSDSEQLSLQFQKKIESLNDNYKIAFDESPTLISGKLIFPIRNWQFITIYDFLLNIPLSIAGIESLGENFVSVDRIVVQQKHSYEDLSCREIVTFPSFMERVKDIILHVANNSPVCVIGPIGSGKSTTIRQVFSLCGRQDYPDLISVQMNDQIDSRVILGSYHSTDLPGQFVWKPGCLTKAVLNGHWIIFEDIDAAPADVITLLEGFIDTKTLSVAGYGEIDYIHPEFRIFGTCRSLGSNQGWSHGRIGKLWKKVVLNNYCIEDLKLIVHSRYPHLRPIVEVLVNIYISLNNLSQGKSVGNSRALSVR